MFVCMSSCAPDTVLPDIRSSISIKVAGFVPNQINTLFCSLAGHTKNTYGDFRQVFVSSSGMLELPIRF